jgi:hypothetical protein
MEERQGVDPAGPKTWGPFTGRQLTTLLCVLIVMALFPVGAWAVSGSNAFVTDATTGAHASVDSSHNLQTKVNGVVTANQAPTQNWVQSGSFLLTVNNTYNPIISASATHALVITDMHLDWEHQDPQAVDYVKIDLGTTPACSTLSSNATEYFEMPDANDDKDVEWGTTGYVVPAGKTLCAASPTHDGTVYIRVFGYFVAASAVVSPYDSRAAAQRLRNP